MKGRRSGRLVTPRRMHVTLDLGAGRNCRGHSEWHHGPERSDSRDENLLALLAQLALAAHAAGRRVLHGVDYVGQGAVEAVELPDDEHVARPERAQAAVESRAVVADAGRAVVVDVAGVDARCPQGFALQVQRLGASAFETRA